MFFLVLLLTSFQSLASPWVDPRVIQLTKEGVRAVEEKNYSLAQEKFSAALAVQPYSPELQINMGLVFSLEGKVDEARQAYKAADKLADQDETHFVANFNLGELEGREKHIDEALAYYQKALEYKPDSKETKTNIELLIGQGSGKGGSDDQDKKDDQQDDKDNKDNKDKKDGKQDQQPKKYAPNKPQPQKFKSENLSQTDVNRILEELKNQEKRIRAEYNRRQVKEKPRGKDW